MTTTELILELAKLTLAAIFIYKYTGKRINFKIRGSDIEALLKRRGNSNE